MKYQVGDLIKYHDGDYHGIALIKDFTRNGLEVEVAWITADAPNGRNYFNNTIFSFKFLNDPTFWNKL